MGLLINSKGTQNTFIRKLLLILFTAILCISVYKAQEYYNQALRYKQSGLSYYNDGYFLEAIKEFENARALHYSSNELLSLQANAYMYMKKYELAESTYKILISKDKKNVWAMNQLAVLYLKTDLPNKSILILQKALEADPEFTGSLILMGQAHEKLENFSEAAKYYDYAERQLNNHIITKIARESKERVSFKKSYKNATSWLHGREMPKVKKVEAVFPVVQAKVVEGFGGWYDSSNKITIIASDANPVYFKFNKDTRTRVSGLPIISKKKSNSIALGVPDFNTTIDKFPIAPFKFKTIRVRTEKNRAAVAQVWPKPLSKVSDPSFLQIRLSGISFMPETLAGAKFDLFTIKGMKKVKGYIDFELDRGLVYFKPRSPLQSGRYIAYFDPRLKSDEGQTLVRSKTWLFTVN